MYDRDQPELLAFRELETLVRHLGDELAVFRRRALTAEGRLRELESAEGSISPTLHARLQDLERENAELRGRLAAAGERVQQMYARVHFLRQQAQQHQAAPAQAAQPASREGGADR